MTESMSITLKLGYLVAVLGSAFTFGYNLSISNQPQDYIVCWIQNTQYNSDFECQNATELSMAGLFTDATATWSLCSAVLAIGAAIGSFSAGPIMNTFGRKVTMIANSILNITVAIVLALSTSINSIAVFILFRVLFGLVVGINSSVAPVYLAEIAPKRLHGAFGTSFQLGVTIGILFADIVGLQWLLGETRWGWAFATSAVPSVFQILMISFTPETPAYLLMKGDVNAANSAAVAFKGRDAVPFSDMADKVRAG